MLSQKIAFLAELVIKGEQHKISILLESVDLFDHSLQVLKNGGFPKNMIIEQKIEKANEEFFPIMDKIEEIWESIKKSTNTITQSKIENEKQIAIHFIEQNAEKLLQLSDNLVKELSESSKKKILNN